MRISPSQTFAGAGAFAGLVLIVAIAFAQPGHAASKAAACPPPAAKTHARAAHVRKTHAVRRARGATLVRTHAWGRRGGGHDGYMDRAWHRHGGVGGRWAHGHQGAGEREWADTREYGEAHHWREGGEAWGASWGERPWATDQYGYLTWPGKTHFGAPAAPEGAGPPPPPPPPPGAMGAPPADPEDGAYIIRRF